MKRKIKLIVLLFIVNFCYLPVSAQIQENTTTLGKIKILGYKDDISIFVSDYYAENKTSNNLVDRVFILQSDNDYSTEYLDIEEICEIVVFPGIIRINYSENILLLGLERNYENLLQQLSGEKIQSFVGYGLSQVNVQGLNIDRSNLTNQLYKSTFDFVQTFITEKAAPIFGDKTCKNCTSGGTGSTSCSLTQLGNECSVSCSSGYFACCKYADCRCCKIEGAAQLRQQPSIYPNPATSEINIDFKLANEEYVRFIILQEFNTGNIVYNKENITENTIRIETATFKKGYYVVSYSIDGYIMSSLLLIQ